MCKIFGGGNDASKKAAQEAAAREEQRKQRITQGQASINQALSPYNDEYFAGREKAYNDYAMPQLEDQHTDAKKALVFALSRSGLLNSSTAADRTRKLNEEYARYQTDIGNSGKNFANQGRTNLENVRGNLISQLTATEDPAAAAASASQQAALLSQPPAFDPVGTFAFNAASDLEELSNRNTGYRGYGSQPIQFNSGGSRGSSTVTRA